MIRIIWNSSTPISFYFFLSFCNCIPVLIQIPACHLDVHNYTGVLSQLDVHNYRTCYLTFLITSTQSEWTPKPGSPYTYNSHIPKQYFNNKETTISNMVILSVLPFPLHLIPWVQENESYLNWLILTRYNKRGNYGSKLVEF